MKFHQLIASFTRISASEKFKPKAVSCQPMIISWKGLLTNNTLNLIGLENDRLFIQAGLTNGRKIVHIHLFAYGKFWVIE